MSEHMQASRPPRTSRAERVTTSCSECRRRKQRCNQGHPCSNCARRFPQPVCEYKERTPRERLPNTSSFVVNFQQQNHDDAELPGLHLPLLPLPAPPPKWAEDSQEASGLVSWSGIDILTQYPDSESASKANTTQWGSIKFSDVPNCEPSCTLHSDTLHEAVRLLKYANSIPNRYITSWDAKNAQEDVDWNKAVGATSNLYALASPVELLHSLPLAPTSLNAELLQIHVKLLSRFKPSLDGNPDFNGPYHKLYLPFCIQTPLLAHVSIYTAACFLNETKHLDKTVAMLIKGHAIRMLNDLLRSDQFATSDEAIAGVAQLITDEWYWGDTHDLREHLRGLREMIKLRGGFSNLGMNGLLSKMVILVDFCIALTFEIPPFLQPGVEFEFNDPNPGPFKVCHNTPLVSPMVTFASCAEAMRLHPTAASILDDIRFLIATIVALPEDAPAQENRKLQSTARWIHERIAALPEMSPETPKPTPSPPPQQTSRRVSTSPVASHTSSQGQQDGGTPLTASSATDNTQEDNTDQRVLEFSPDFLYQSIRKAALIYTSAIVARRPFSESCSPDELYGVWTTMWRVPLAAWKTMMGIFLWIEIAITPPSRDTPHGRFVKSMLTIAGLSMGIENWSASSNALRGAMKLQAWLKGEHGKGKEIVGPEGGGPVIERKGSEMVKWKGG